MTVAGVSTNDAKHIVKTRLKEQWVILYGDMDVIRDIEYSLYTPGTPKNADFELVLVSMFHRIFLAKKNDLLNRFLHRLEKNLTDFSGIVSVMFEYVGDNKIVAHIKTITQDKDFNESVDVFVETLFSQLLSTRSQSGEDTGGK